MTDDCAHDWSFIEDWEGDPSLPGGTNDVSYYFCHKCELEQTETPETFEDPAPELDDFYDDQERADYVYDPLKRDP